ncbi:RNA polymerase sigma-70 factor [Parasegetibacter sp. NRK P23]|nr:RNA polymerase sigma-70 factor [Parasegetibacter sp. NRK P23]
MYDQYRVTVYSFAYTLVKTDILAEEITQDVFIKVWENRTQLKTMNYFSTWIRTIARNAAYSFFRRAGVEKRALEELGETVAVLPAPDEKLEFREMERRIQQVFSELTPQQQTIFRMSREEGRTYAEIAGRLNISVHTVKYHLTNISALLRSRIGPFLTLLLFIKK